MSLNRTCNKCGIAKPIDQFNRNKAMPGGRLKCCRDCTKAYAKNFREANPEKLSAYEAQRSKTAARKDWVKRAFKKVLERHPEKIAARQAVNNALRFGRLKPQPCFICGKKAEAHHPDYSSPLNVTWLCFEHHRELHKEMKGTNDDLS